MKTTKAAPAKKTAKPPITPLELTEILTGPPYCRELESVHVWVEYYWSNEVRKVTANQGPIRNLERGKRYRVCIVTRRKFEDLSKGIACGDETHADLRTAARQALERVGLAVPAELAGVIPPDIGWNPEGQKEI